MAARTTAPKQRRGFAALQRGSDFPVEAPIVAPFNNSPDVTTFPAPEPEICATNSSTRASLLTSRLFRTHFRSRPAVVGGIFLTTLLASAARAADTTTSSACIGL